MELTRRRLLGAAAAAALAAALPACGRRRSRIGGRIVDSSDARGHLLRSSPDDAAPAGREETRVAIVGGGVAGLSAAWKLERAGLRDFVLLELEDTPGGTSQAGRNSVSAYPWGAHYVPVPTREQATLCELLTEVGAIRGFDPSGRAVAAEEHLCRAPQERRFRTGTWSEGLYPIEGAGRGDLAQLERFHAETAALASRRDSDGRRAFAIPVERSSRDPDLVALDRITMAQWMDARGYDAMSLRWWVEYACRDDFGTTLGTTSAWAALHYFCSRVAVPGDDPAEFLTWPEGNGFLVRHLAGVAGGRVRGGAVVRRVAQDETGATVRWTDAAGGETRELRASRVVCATPRFVAARVVEGLEPEPAFGYAPWVVANLTLRSRPRERGFPLCWDNVLVESESLGYVVATHQTDRLGDDSVWTWYRPFCGPDPRAERTRVLEAGWEDWRDDVLRDLVRAHPDLGDHVVSIDVRRWGHAMVRPVPGFVFGGARRRAAASLGRVHFAGADLGGLPLFEEAQWSGVRAAEEALAAEGVAFVSSL